MPLFLSWHRPLRWLWRPLVVARLRPALAPDWRVLCRCRGTRLDINVACGQLLIAGLDRAEIRPLSDLRDAIACQRRGRTWAELHLRLGDCAGDTAIIRCIDMAQARHLSGLLLAVRHGVLRPMPPKLEMPMGRYTQPIV